MARPARPAADDTSMTSYRDRGRLRLLRLLLYRALSCPGRSACSACSASGAP